MEIEAKLEALGLVLPPPIQAPLGVRLPFAAVRVLGRRAFISGHSAQNPDGSVAGPFGKVDVTVLESGPIAGKWGDMTALVSVEDGYNAARLTALSMLASLKRELGDLDRVTAWLRVFGMVNSAPGFALQPKVINGFSDLIIELYGPIRGAHARSAVGMAELPFHIPVEIEAEVEIDG